MTEANLGRKGFFQFAVHHEGSPRPQAGWDPDGGNGSRSHGGARGCGVLSRSSDLTVLQTAADVRRVETLYAIVHSHFSHTDPVCPCQMDKEIVVEVTQKSTFYMMDPFV